jgi:putative protease
MTTPRTTPELLSPAGNCAALKAAVSAGADAVYLGGKHFSARGYADNFTEAQIKDAIDYAHLHRVKVYAAVNTLIKDTELNTALKYTEYLYELGIDAIITQDLGLASLLLKELPDLPLHASTQMNVHNTQGAIFLENLGFKRIILARELSLQEIAAIKQNTHIELEVFIHGALCISYSGQCLLSSMIGGRSGNRGLCAQPCRKKYTLHTKNKQLPTRGRYLLSPKDLNTSSYLSELVEAGVSCFKIEGRMKSPTYVAGVTRTYRNLIDNNYQQTNTDELSKSFNRGFTAGYLHGNPERLINPYSPENLGEPLGHVIKSTGDTLTLKLSKPLSSGDGITIHENNTITGTGIARILRQQLTERGEYLTTIPFNKKLPEGSKVYRTHHHQYVKVLQQMQPPKQAVQITAFIVKNRPMKLALTCGNITIHVEGEHIAVPARKAPLTEEAITKQLTKLHNTPFHPEHITIELEENTFLPLSEINRLRRCAVEKLKNTIITGHRRTRHHLQNPAPTTSRQTTENNPTPRLAVRVDSLETLEAAIDGGADIIYFGGTILSTNKILKPADYQHAIQQCREHNVEIYLDTPAITKESELTEVRRLLQLTQPGGMLTSNLGTLRIAQQQPELTIVTDYTIPTFNLQTLQFLHTHRVHRATLSPELNRSEIRQITPHGNTEIIVHGNIPLMSLQHCILKNHLNCEAGKCRVNCTQNHYLKDEKNYLFPLKTDQYCRNHILNSKELCLLPYLGELMQTELQVFRIEAKAMFREQVERITRCYRKAIKKGSSGSTGCKNHTTWHYRRGVE